MYSRLLWPSSWSSGRHTRNWIFSFFKYGTISTIFFGFNPSQKRSAIKVLFSVNNDHNHWASQKVSPHHLFRIPFHIFSSNSIFQKHKLFIFFLLKISVNIIFMNISESALASLKKDLEKRLKIKKMITKRLQGNKTLGTNSSYLLFILCSTFQFVRLFWYCCSPQKHPDNELKVMFYERNNIFEICQMKNCKSLSRPRPRSRTYDE